MALPKPISVENLKLNGSTAGAITVQAPASFTSYSLTLPSDDGVSGQALITNGTGTLSWDNTSVSFPLLAPDGTAAAPSYSFTNNTDLGFYRSGADSLSIAVSGVQHTLIDTNNFTINDFNDASSIAGLRVTNSHLTGTAFNVSSNSVDALRVAGGQTLIAASSSLTAPPISFVGDIDTGIRRVSTDQIGIVCGGIATINIQTDRFFMTNINTASTLAGINVTNAGTGSTLLCTSNGTQALAVRNSHALLASSTSLTLPPLAFSGDEDTGIRRVTTNEIGVVAGGSEAARFNAAAFECLDGTSSLPGIAFISDTNTGIFRVGSDQLGFAVAGQQALSLQRDLNLWSDNVDGAEVIWGNAAMNHITFAGISGQLTRFGLFSDQHNLTDASSVNSATAPNSDAFLQLNTTASTSKRQLLRATPNDLSVSGATDIPQILFDTSNTLTWSDAPNTSLVTNMQILAPTFAATAAQSTKDVATLYIDSGPIDGTNWTTGGRRYAALFNSDDVGIKGTLVANQICGFDFSSSAETNFSISTTNLSTTSGSSVTTTGTFIPAGALVIGVTIRVGAAITGATSFDVGDGTDIDRWGAAIAVASNTTTDGTDFTDTTIDFYPSGGEVTLTANGSNFTGGVVNLAVHYITLVARAT